MKNVFQVAAIAVLTAACSLAHAAQNEQGNKSQNLSPDAVLYATQLTAVTVCGAAAVLTPSTLMQSSSAFDYLAGIYLAGNGADGISLQRDALARAISSMKCDSAGVLQLTDRRSGKID